MDEVREFWDRVARYKEMGMDPLKWIAGCAVKVDLTTVVYPALRQIRPELETYGIHVSSRADADMFPSHRDNFEVERRIYNLESPRVDPEDLRRVNPDRGISLVQVHQRSADKPEKFAEALLRLYREIGRAHVDFTVGKGHSIITPYPQAQFALFDFLREPTGTPDGYTLANNDTIQVIDPTLDPASPEQAAVAVSNSLNDLLTLGVHEDLGLLPVYDAPTPGMRERIAKNMADFARRHGLRLHDAPQPQTGKLLMGATVIGRTHREPPHTPAGFTPGMEIVVTRPFGDLAPINVYLSCLADEEYMKKLGEAGLTLDEARRAKEDVVKTMTQPNLEVGRIIARYRPAYGQKFNPTEHIAGTGDLSGPGVYIFKEMAQLAKADLRLDTLPLAYPRYVEFATREFIMDNGTAGTNGAVAMVAQAHISESIQKDLRRAGYNPQVIGRVLGPGPGRVTAPRSLEGMVANRGLLKEFELT
ncbi:MAG: SelD-related putative sulfur metabolism protein [Euryarchaeota archaeon]|nr:SelD-related putative sulfur metabolism protein [Euryarchaeota archaeon]